MSAQPSTQIDDLATTSFGEKYLLAQGRSLIKFGEGSFLESGGFGYLDSQGKVDAGKPLEAWINCRMTHVFGLAYLLGLSDRRDLVTHGVNALLDLFEDKEFGG